VNRHSHTALAGLAGASIVVGLALLVAAPVGAATLPDGQTITTVGTDDGDAYTVDPATAGLTLVGPSGVSSITAADVNDEGLGYALMGSPATGVQSVLYDFDATTGMATDPHPITVENHGTAFACLGLDYSGGVLVAGCMYQFGVSQFVVVGVLDPATGVLAEDVATTDPSPVVAVAKDPDGGTIWVVNGAGALLNADLAAGTYTPVAVIQPGEAGIYGADFDRDGQLFITYALVAGTPPTSEVTWRLGTLDPATGNVTSIGQLTGNVRTEAVTVWGEVPEEEQGEDPGPALPATGSEVERGLVVGALLLLGIGAAILFAVRRRTI
jgi:LPXTG-motif cell wall-anchored protein